MVGKYRSGQYLTAAAAALLLVACGKSPEPSPGAGTAATTAATNALTPELAAIYARSCANCHSQPATGAPQAGDRAAWAPRVAQGRDRLLEHAINGYKAMPPLGTCMDCSPEQFAALIDYMAGTPAGH